MNVTPLFHIVKPQTREEADKLFERRELLLSKLRKLSTKEPAYVIARLEFIDVLESLRHVEQFYPEYKEDAQESVEEDDIKQEQAGAEAEGLNNCI